MASTGTTSRHQVVIVGADITGLTTALMLQELGIDYVLLEAYGSITPEMGASFGFFANGLRILDQLGLYPELEKLGAPAKAAIYRDSTNGGKLLMSRASGPLLKDRHGYANMFLSRHQLLCVLHDGVREKERLLVNRRVVTIDDDADAGCARVHTTDGSVYEAQLVVGADGVRSYVRKEMWRHAEEREEKSQQLNQKSWPFAITAADKADKGYEYACLYGTSKPKPGFTPGDVVAACGMMAAAGLMGALNGDVFFFWFWRLPAGTKCSIDDIPRISDEEKQAQIERCKNTIVSEDGLTMGDVLDDVRFPTGATALPHFVLDRWHSGGRVVVIGDAAHKFNPLVGQGGNSCIESAAALVNALQEHVFASLPDKTAEWPQESLTRALTALENERVGRVRDMVNQCQEAIGVVAWNSWKPKLVTRYIAPLVPISKMADFHSAFIRPGIRLRGYDFKAPPPTEHSMPYDDEKEKPLAAAAA
ncbi:FAD dependent monooxygenase [Microdochium nivale]|nr:FAD dependent monooxygenase [Microdochium nivale]